MPSSLNIILTELPKLRPSEIFYVSKAVEDQAMSIATVTTVSDEIKEKRFNKVLTAIQIMVMLTVNNAIYVRVVASLLVILQTLLCQGLKEHMTNGLVI